MIPFMTVLKAYTELNGELSVAEQVLFFRLFLINNKAGWAEWFGADNRRLMLDTGVKSEHTIISARNSLKQKGLIDFVSGKKGQPTRYTLTTILSGNTAINTVNKCTVSNAVKSRYTATNTVENAVKDACTATSAVDNENTAINTVNTAVNNAVNNAVKSAGIIDIETRDKETETKKEAAAAASEGHAIEEVMTAFSQNIHPITGELERDMLIDLCNDYGCQWTLEAIKEAVSSNGFSVKYISAILKRWKAQGFKSTKFGAGKKVTENGKTVSDSGKVQAGTCDDEWAAAERRQAQNRQRNLRTV